MNFNHFKNLPIIIVYTDLHLSESLKAAIKELTGISGVYAIINTLSDKVYIGSSINIGFRLFFSAHLVYNTTNEHLQNAIALCGLSNFVVVLVEQFEPDPSLSDDLNRAALLEREQYWLNWLFSLPVEFRYNFNPDADCPPSPLGRKLTLQRKPKRQTLSALARRAARPKAEPRFYLGLRRGSVRARPFLSGGGERKLVRLR